MKYLPVVMQRHHILCLGLALLIPVWPFVCLSVCLCIFTVRKRSCGKLIFSQAWVKNSVHGGGEGGAVCQTATAADGTHSTGMHSCFILHTPYHYIKSVAKGNFSQIKLHKSANIRFEKSHIF